MKHKLIALLGLAALFGTACTGGNARSIAVGTPGPANPAGQGGSQKLAFDGDKAFALLVKQCDFGPRPVGSEAHQKTRDFLMAEMQKYADKTEAQNFTFSGKVHRPNGTIEQVKKVDLTNIIGVFNPGAKRSVLLCGHWDTRPTSDQEIDPVKQMKPIIGASDGASEIAVLLELARNFKEKRPSVGVIIVLLDGEDFGDFTHDEGVFLGARFFASHHSGYNAEYGVLLDMVGDKNLNIKREGNSDRFAPGTNTKVFNIARELGYGQYLIDDRGYEISDDHVSITTVGRIPTIDLIDFDYAPWHTQQDTPDKCSAKSLAIVGGVLSQLIYRER